MSTYSIISRVASLIAIMALACAQASAASLQFDATTVHDLRCSCDQSTGVTTLVTQGTDPYVYFAPLNASLGEDETVLSFEYKTEQGIDNLEVYFSPVSSARRQNIGSTGASGEWRVFTFNLNRAMRKYAWGKRGDTIRIDLGGATGVTLQVRGVQLRRMNAAEKAAADKVEAQEAAKLKKERDINFYLRHDYPSSIASVEVTSKNVIIKGTCGGNGKYSLVEVAPYNDVTESKRFPTVVPITGKQFSITLPRKARRGGFGYDRLLSRWAVMRHEAKGMVLDSHARYADDVAPLSKPAAMPLLGKKGVGGYSDSNVKTPDLDSLGIHSVTVNIWLTDMVYSHPVDGAVAHSYGGKTYYFKGNQVKRLDNTFGECYKRGIVTAAILLVAPNNVDNTLSAVFRHPDFQMNSSAFYSMPNMTTPAGVNLYAACIDFLASRYNSARHGRINHWILQNEVDMGYVWTNMGDQPEGVYTDEYLKSMRMCYNIARQYDPNAAVMGSFTHNWTAAEAEGFASKSMLEQTLRYSRAEGDFWWGVAQHPYPQNLGEPEFWINDKQATFDLNAPYVTFYNLEVIDKWIQLPETLYKGSKKRLLFLSENGTNSPSYSDKDLRNQAAGACWAWKKLNALKGIDAVQWHAHIDNRGEFGLRIGLLKYRDEEGDPYGKKPVWRVWQAAGTPQENAVFQPYLNVIGINSWDQIFHTVK